MWARLWLRCASASSTSSSPRRMSQRGQPYAEQARERLVGQGQHVGARHRLPVEAGDHVAARVLQLAAQVDRAQAARVAGRDMQDQSRRRGLTLD